MHASPFPGCRLAGMIAAGGAVPEADGAAPGPADRRDRAVRRGARRGWRVGCAPIVAVCGAQHPERGAGGSAAPPSDHDRLRPRQAGGTRLDPARLPVAWALDLPPVRRGAAGRGLHAVLGGGGAVLKSRLPAVAEQRNFAANGGLAFSVIALVGFQGRGVADGLHPDLCPSLLLEALIFQWS